MQGELFNPHFDGRTYQPNRDHKRLTGQLTKVKDLMRDGQWWTIPKLVSSIPGSTPQAISARIRDLRKPKFGGLTVETKAPCRGGLWAYRMRGG